jgi:hypothetical protein
MRYVAVLKGQAGVFANIASYFSGDAARIGKLDDNTWVLESVAFNSCTDADDVFPIADALLRPINCLLALYAHLLSPLAVTAIQAFNAQDVPTHRRIRTSATINVYSAQGIGELSSPRGTASLGSVLAQKATVDGAVREALNLRGDQEMAWSQIYDIIEFLGGPDEIRPRWVGEKEAAREIRQTANHFRHLGSTKNYPLQVTPPTINEARAFADELLKRWIASRF